jgi:hypothetical protein
MANETRRDQLTRCVEDDINEGTKSIVFEGLLGLTLTNLLQGTGDFGHVHLPTG